MFATWTASCLLRVSSALAWYKRSHLQRYRGPRHLCEKSTVAGNWLRLLLTITAAARATARIACIEVVATRHFCCWNPSHVSPTADSSPSGLVSITASSMDSGLSFSLNYLSRQWKLALAAPFVTFQNWTCIKDCEKKFQSNWFFTKYCTYFRLSKHTLFVYNRLIDLTWSAS